MKAVKKDVFDINKVTVVGSPTITSDGVASGFSNANYLTTPLSIIPTSNIVIKTKSIYSTVGNTSEYPQSKCIWMLDWDSFRINSSNGKTIDIVSTVFGTDRLDVGTLKDGDIIETEVVLTTSKLVLNVTVNGQFYTFSKNVTTTFGEIGTLYIGKTRTGNYYWTGSIDLKQFSITVDGELVYSPTRPTTFLERRKEGFDLSKFTVVGSPTITDDGVASGFGAGVNYITTPSFNLTGYNSLVIKSKAKYSLSNGSLWWLQGLGIRLVIANSNGTLQLFGNSQILYFSKNEIGTPSEGDDIETITTITSTGATVEVIVDDVLYSKSATTSITLATIEKCGIGCSYAGYAIYANSIDLKQFSITVDGKEVFTGAKEKFYAIGD